MLKDKIWDKVLRLNFNVVFSFEAKIRLIKIICIMFKFWIYVFIFTIKYMA
jgi:hypothetical protein